MNLVGRSFSNCFKLLDIFFLLFVLECVFLVVVDAEDVVWLWYSFYLSRFYIGFSIVESLYADRRRIQVNGNSTGYSTHTYAHRYMEYIPSTTSEQQVKRLAVQREIRWEDETRATVAVAKEKKKSETIALYCFRFNNDLDLKNESPSILASISNWSYIFLLNNNSSWA